MKWRYFKHLLHGGDPEAERIYLWHIQKRREANAAVAVGMDADKRTDDDFIAAAWWLIDSMYEGGFEPLNAIPVDPDGELLGGAHRTACALALGIDVFVQPQDRKAWAPDWGFKWFVDQGMAFADLIRLKADWETIHGTKADPAGCGGRSETHDIGSLPANS